MRGISASFFAGDGITTGNAQIIGAVTFTNNGFFSSAAATGNTITIDLGSTPGFVNNGTIEVDNSALQFATSLENAGTITVTAGTTMGVTGNLTMDANTVLDIAAPTAVQMNGNLVIEPTTVAVSGNFTMNAGAMLDIRLGSAATSAQLGTGLLNIGGTASFGGTLVTLPPPNFTPAIGSRFKFATFASEIGAFGSVQEGALGTGEKLSLDTTVAGQLNLDVVPA